MIRRLISHIQYLMFFVAAALLLTSCFHADDFEDTPEGNLEALWTLIDEHYCFLDYKREAIGLDWNEVCSRYRARLSDDMTKVQLFEVLSEMLAELRDGHVNLYTPADVGRNWSWYEDYPRNFYQDLQDDYLGTDYKIAGNLRYRFLDDNVGYVVCSTFASGFGDGNLDEVFYGLRSCSGLILDLRNNGGGDLTYAQRLASRFTNERLEVGYISHKTGKGHGDFSALQKEYLAPSEGVRWQKPVVVLTNRSCYSAANTFVRDMKCCPNVTILGDQTGGGSGMPFSGELPNGWNVRFSACPMYDINKNHIEFGIQPDILVSLTDEDRARHLDTLIEAARQLLH